MWKGSSKIVLPSATKVEMNSGLYLELKRAVSVAMELQAGIHSLLGRNWRHACARPYWSRYT